MGLRKLPESARFAAAIYCPRMITYIFPLHFRKAKPYEFIWRMDDTLQFAQECGTNVGLLLDSWHRHHAGANTNDIIAAGRDRIVHVHFNTPLVFRPIRFATTAVCCRVKVLSTCWLPEGAGKGWLYGRAECRGV